jgi:hypothetical protein
MSRSAKITLTWGDGEYTFRLRIAELVELQEKCDAGPAFILERLATGRWKVEDIRETIRLGLIGGAGGDKGFSPSKATTLVQRYVDARPLQENINHAYAILAASVVGHEDEPLGKPKGETAESDSQTSPEENSGSLSSTPVEQSSA